MPGHLGQVGMYIPASTHTHLFMWPTCWAPVPGIRTPQTLTGIGFYVSRRWADWTGWGSPVCEPRPGWCGCLKVVQTAHDFAPLCTAFRPLPCTDLYRRVPLTALCLLAYMSVVQTSTNQYKHKVTRWYSGTTPYGCTVVPLTSSRT